MAKICPLQQAMPLFWNFVLFAVKIVPLDAVAAMLFVLRDPAGDWIGVDEVTFF